MGVWQDAAVLSGLEGVEEEVASLGTHASAFGCCLPACRLLSSCCPPGEGPKTRPVCSSYGHWPGESWIAEKA